MRGKWEGIGFILDFEDREPGDVAFILNVPGGEVTINDLRKAAAAPALYEALDELNKTIGGYMLTKGEDRLRYHAQLKGPVAAKVRAALSLAHPPKGDEP